LKTLAAAAAARQAAACTMQQGRVIGATPQTSLTREARPNRPGLVDTYVHLAFDVITDLLAIWLP